MKISVLPILIALVIGLGGGYYWGKSKCNPQNSSFDFKNLSEGDKADLAKFYEENSFVLAGKDSSRPIKKPLAYKLIMAFQNQNESRVMPFPVRTVHGKAKGYFIDRAPIEKILKNPSWSGISVFFAKDQTAPTGSKRIYTLIYMGGRYNADSTKVTNHLKTGQILARGDGSDTLAYDFVKPCPTVCSDFDGHEPPPSLTKVPTKHK
jgi:hypothetical protein